jgi:hypothetical protein
MLKEKLELGIFKPSDSPYSNRWFFQRKPNGKYRFLLDLQPLNSVTIKDVSTPPSVDSYAESFAGQPILSSSIY